jgi:bifunctional lysine-specific demethylase and histidyl-hydroxylase NO66
VSPGRVDAWVDRRQFHIDAPRLGDFVGDASCFVAGELALRRLSIDAPWGDPERLWDRFLTGGVRAPAFRLVRLGATLSRRDYCRSAPVGNEQLEDILEPNRVLEHYSAGATVVLQALQFSDRAYAELSTNLALQLDHPVQVNAYLTPPAERGLDIHFDFHDVVVVQLAGRKRWRIWPALPRSQRPVKRGPPVRQPSPDELGVAVFDRVLEPGDCLAIPRGLPHAAEAMDVESAHLTIGIMALTWNRVLRDLIDDVGGGSALADRLPFGGLGGVQDADRPHPHEALAALTDGLSDHRIRHAVTTEVWRRQPQTRFRLRQPTQVELHQQLLVTPGPLLWIDTSSTADAQQTLHLGDRRLRFPAECTPFVAAVLQSPASFSGAALDSDLDVASRSAVLRRLATEGVIGG